MNRGYFKTWRKIINSAVFQNEGLLKVFIWSLARAAYKETFVMVRTGRGVSEVKLLPGSFLFGRDSAARELNMSPSTVWKRMLKLKNLEILNIESNSHYSIIYIINWHLYQADSEKSDSDSNRQVTGKEHKEEIKEVKNNIYRENSKIVLNYLNQKTGKHYRDISFVEARLKDGGSIDECKRIIDVKMQDPHFKENPKYLNPQTLFRKSHWDNYLNESLPITGKEHKPAPAPLSLSCPRCGRDLVVKNDLYGDGCVYCQRSMEART